MLQCTNVLWSDLEGTKTFGGTVGVFTDPEASDTPVLGRGVLDHFRLIFDRGRNIVLLLAPPHDYDVVVR